ncbi:MAG: D-glycero-beta-D-manno-heptose 1-phosphate adenylyltransferase [Thermodesulfobacteriota bacterium]|nr:D-glycero-beta-D-manno-heptose 1-phosphate adenylyltransferase [Thermodesulfobacteriota bacterium]
MSAKETLTHPKILKREKLLARLKDLGGKKIVFTNGCFDILHAGHADLMARAKSQGDVLVVGVNSDASVRRIKGPSRPLTPEAQRTYLLASLACVDFVTLFDEDTPEKLILAVLPDVLVKGGDWPKDKIVGRDSVEVKGGKVLSLPLLKDISTTSLVERIIKNCTPPQ